MNESKSSESKEQGLPKVLSWSTGMVGLLGLIGLLTLLAQDAWSADPQPRGFQPGGRANSPFANQPPAPPSPPAGKPNFFDEGDDEDFEFPEDGGGGVNFPPSTGSISAGGAPNSGGQDPIRTDQGIAVGGGSAGGVVPHGKAVAAEHVDTETAEGSKAVVTDFNFPDADIMDIAKTLGKLTGKNFILDKDVKGKITVISNSPITVGDAWKAFLTALDMNGFALIPSGKYIRIARQRDARDKQLKTYTGEFSPDTDALITRVFPLKYISAEEVARTFRSFMPANSRIIPYEQTNTVIVTDTGSNIAKLSKMLEILDVEGYDAGIEVIPVKYASAQELSKLIDTLIPGTSAGGPGTPGGAPRFGGGGSRFSARRTKEGGIINTIISDERTNTLIVHANTKGADQVRELVAKLDQKIPAQQGGGKVHVVYLQFAEAEAIATTLNNLSQGAQQAARPAGPTGGTGSNPVTATLFEGGIRVSADKATNSLVITASPADFVTVQRVINRLDIPRDEVYIEVVIMEIGLSRSFNFSANVALPTNGILLAPEPDAILSAITNPLSQAGAVFRIPYGNLNTQTLPGGAGSVQFRDVESLIKFIQTNSNATVLATPQIIALDNTEANFESAEKIPTPTTTVTQGAGSTSGVSYQNIALSIKIKPQINKMSNFVKLDVTTKLGDVSQRELPQAVKALAFATTERTAQTTVVVGDSDTVVIGGLIRDKTSESTAKVPLLGDIPILGWLFKKKSTEVVKSNLLIFMTPHIVKQYDKVRMVLDKKLKERDDFIENEMGGLDPLRDKRNDIIRSLPDIKQLSSQRPNVAAEIDPAQTGSTEGNTTSIGGGDPFSPKTAPLPTGGNNPGSRVIVPDQPPPPMGMDAPAPPPPLE